MPGMPAALQITQLTEELNRSVGSFNNSRGTFETVATSLDSLQKMFRSSQIFKRARIRNMSNFYKVAPQMYKNLTHSINNLTQTILEMGQTSFTTGASTITTTTENALLSDLLDRIGVLSGNINTLGIDVNNLDIDLSPEASIQVGSLQSDLESLRIEMMDVMNQVASSSRGIGGAATEVGNLSGNLSDMARQFSILVRDGQISSNIYSTIIRRINNVNVRLRTSQTRLSGINENLHDITENQNEAADGIKKGVNAMLALQALDLFKGVGAGDVEDQISSLHDELIDLRKTMADASLPIEEWRRSAIDTAKAFNALGIAADPAEMAHLYSVIGKAGVRTAKDVQTLAKSIKLVTEATDIGAEEAAEFSYVLADSWGLGTKFVDKYNSMLVKMQSLHNVSAAKIMSQTKEMGGTFMTVLRDLSQAGKEAFMVHMANALGSLESAFIEDKELVKDLALALTDPAQAAEKFADMLQGTGYNIRQMAVDLKKGNITTALEKIFKGSEKFANMSAEQLRIVSERSGKSVEDLIKMSQQSGIMIKNLTKLQREGIEEIADPKALIKLAQEENKKLGTLFERLGKKIKTWISDIGIGAIEGLGVEILDLAPTLAPIVIILDKLGFSMSGIGNAAKWAGKGIIKAGENLFTYMATSVAANGIIATFSGLLTTAKAGMLAFGASVYTALGPIGLAILGITAVTTAIIALVKWGPTLWKWFGEKFPKAAEIAYKAFAPIGEMFKKIWDVIKPIGIMMSKMIGNVLAGAFKVLWSVAKFAFKIFKVGFLLMWKIAEPVIKLLVGGLTWLWEKFVPPKDKDAQSSFEAWITGAKLMIDGIKWLTDKVTGYFNYLSVGLDTIGEDFDLFIIWIGSGLVRLGERIADWTSKLGALITAPFEWIYSKISGFVALLKGLFTDFAVIIVNAISSPFNTVSNIISFVVDKVKSLLDLVGGTTMKAVKGIANFFGFGKKEAVQIAPQTPPQPAYQTTAAVASTSQNMASGAKSIAKVGENMMNAYYDMKFMPFDATKAAKYINAFNSSKWNKARAQESIGPVVSRNSVIGSHSGYVEDIAMMRTTPGKSKVMEPEFTQKIFAERPETIIRPVMAGEVDVHQEDVVLAIQRLTAVIQKGQTKQDQNTRRPALKPTDEQAELVRQWAL